MFKNILNMASMFRQAGQITTRMQEMQESLKQKRVEGASGAGLVQVVANGVGEILSLTIDPTLIERGEREMIEDLVPAAVNDAVAKAKLLHADLMKELTGGLNIPGLDDAISQMAGVSDAPAPNSSP